MVVTRSQAASTTSRSQGETGSSLVSPLPHEFPLDLLQCITDLLSDEPAAILACTLTSKTWYRAFRHCIYHTITLAHPRHYDRFLTLVNEEEQIRPWVHNLRVKRCAESPEWIEADTFMPCKGKFPNLHTLEFVNFNQIEKFYPFNDTVRRLAFRDLRIFAAVLADAMLHFPHLSTLEILDTSVRSRRSGARTPTLLQRPDLKNAQLKRLAITAPTPTVSSAYTWGVTEIFLSWFTESGYAHTLQSLDIRLDDPTTSFTSGGIMPLVSATGPSLETLTVIFPPEDKRQKAPKEPLCM